MRSQKAIAQPSPTQILDWIEKMLDQKHTRRHLYVSKLKVRDTEATNLADSLQKGTLQSEDEA